MQRATFVALIFIGGFLFVSFHYVALRLQVGFAADQTRRIENSRQEGIAADPPGAAATLAWLLTDYPSGTKQVTGSPLDTMVERDRNQAIAQIIAHLKRTTRQDLGDAPGPWIKRYNR